MTSTVNNPDPVPRSPSSSSNMSRTPSRALLPLRKARSTRSRRWRNPECFNLFTKEELDAIQWDNLEEEMARSVEYDIVPDYDKLLDIMTSAKREASGG